MMINRSAPAATVVPIVVYEDVGKAIDWLCTVFGFSERLRFAGSDGIVSHAQLVIGQGAVMLGRQGAEFRPPRRDEVNQYVVVHVDAVDQHYERAKQRGARMLRKPTAIRRAAVHRGGSRWTPMDVLSINRRCRAGGMGRHNSKTLLGANGGLL